MAAASTRFGASSLRRMCETCTPAVLTLITSVGGDLAVGEPAGDERQHFRLARREPEGLFEALRRVVWACLRWRQIEPRSLCKQLELVQQGLRSDPGRDGGCLPERHARLGAGRAGGDERLGLAPAAVGRERRALEVLPGRCGLRPRLGPGDPVGALVLGLGQGQPAGRVRRDRRGLGSGAARDSDQLACAIEPAAEGVAVPAGACERRQLRLCAQSLGAELDADLGRLVLARASQPLVDGRRQRPSSDAPRARGRRGSSRRSRARGPRTGRRPPPRGAPAPRRTRRGRSRPRRGR